MNRFASFKYLTAGRGASIYCVIVHDDETGRNKSSEYDRFIDEFSRADDDRAALAEIAAQLERIKDYGANASQLRPESSAFALPSKHRALVSQHFVPSATGPLRLYLALLPDDVLVLCGGGKKTGVDVKASPGVQAHFSLAQTVAKRLNERLAEEYRPINFEKIEGILESETIQL